MIRFFVKRYHRVRAWMAGLISREVVVYKVPPAVGRRPAIEPGCNHDTPKKDAALDAGARGLLGLP